MIFKSTVSYGGISALSQFLRSEPKPGKIAVLTDENTHEYCLPLLEQSIPELSDAEVLMVGAGESSKSPEILSSLWQAMIENGIDRDALLINLGGGVVTDLGGFTAATYKRGIRFIHVPTTLLAMVDASVGGKTGINVGGHKNQAGTFTRPDAVIIDTAFLKTLPERQLRSGAAELYKHALIEGGDLFRSVSRLNFSDPDPFDSNLIKKAVSVKEKVVEEDFEERGNRKILNLGHTVGHAVESGTLGSENELLHGEAVVLGLVIESFIAEEKAGLNSNLRKQILSKLLREYPDVFKLVFDPEMISAFCGSDKKRAGNSLTMPLLAELGKIELMKVSDESIVRAVEKYNEL